MGNNIGAQNTRFGAPISMAEQAALGRETKALLRAQQAYNAGDVVNGREAELAAAKSGMRAEQIHSRRYRKGFTAAPWAHPSVNTINPQLTGGSWPINAIGTPVVPLNGQPTMSMMPQSQTVAGLNGMPLGMEYNTLTPLGTADYYGASVMANAPIVAGATMMNNSLFSGGMGGMNGMMGMNGLTGMTGMNGMSGMGGGMGGMGPGW